MRLRRFAEIYMHSRSRDAAALHSFRPQRPALNAQQRQLRPQIIERHAGVHERAEQHVAADTGEAIEIRDPRQRRTSGLWCANAGTIRPALDIR
jgi:hypothetical protein